MIRSDNLAEAKLAIEYRRGYDDAIAEMNGTNDESKSTQTSLTKTIEELNFSTRTYNCLKRSGINTVYDLICRTEEDMMKVRNLGIKGVDEVREVLNKMCLSFQFEEVW